jgi:diacylglycerol O-acyltransferase / wax synthase
VFKAGTARFGVGGASPVLGTGERPDEAGLDTAARPLSPEDLSILALENETVAGHTCKVILLDRPVDPGSLRASISRRLPRAPMLSMRLGEIDGAPWWVPAHQVDMAAHVVAGPASGAGDEAGLRATVAGIFARHLDRSRPLWQIDVISPRPGGGSALIWRIHHALADGMTAMGMASAVLWDEEPVTGPGEPVTGPRTARTRSRAPRAGRPVPHHRLAALLAAAREAPQPWLRSPFDGHIDARREVAFTTAGLEELHRVAAATDGATVNDAVLTVVAGGLRRWLEAHHGHLGAVRVKVPVSLHALPPPEPPPQPSPGPAPGSERARPGNRDSFFCLDLPLGSADPVERLAAIRRTTRARKQGHDAQHVDALMRELAHSPRLSRFVQHVLAHPRSFALNVSNVPGPRRPIRVLGVPVRALYSLAEIGEHHALRIAVVSLAGTLNVGLVADPTLLADVGGLAAGMQAEAAELTSRLPRP